jgi:hypothetical protein
VRVGAICISVGGHLTARTEVLTRATNNRNVDCCVRIDLMSATRVNAVPHRNDLTTGQSEDQCAKSSLFWVTRNRGDRADTARQKTECLTRWLAELGSEVGLPAWNLTWEIFVGE